MPGYRSVTLAALVGVWPSVASPAPAEPTIRVLPLPRKPTAATIKQFFERGVVLGSSSYGKDLRATFEQLGVPSETCEQPVPWHVTKDSIGFSCDVLIAHFETGTRKGDAPYKEALHVGLISPDVIVFVKDGEGARRVVVVTADDCRAEEKDASANITLRCNAALGEGVSPRHVPSADPHRALTRGAQPHAL
jgi:hypothetical protein